MSYACLAFIDHWITTFDLQAIRDILLESLALLAFLFFLVIIIIAISKNPIFRKHGSVEILIFVIMGLIHSSMNVFDEFAWITSYNFWKLGKDLTLLIATILLVIGFFRFFIFSSRLFGIEKKLTNEEKIKD